MDSINIKDLRMIQYTFRGNGWEWKVDQYISSMDATINRIYLDDPFLELYGAERFIIDIMTSEDVIKPWKVIQISEKGESSVLELKI